MTDLDVDLDNVLGEAPAAHLDGTEEVFKPPGQPMLVARRLLEEFTTHGRFTLRSWRGGWMRWRDSYWSEVEERSLRATIYKRLEHAVYWKVTPKSEELMPWAPNKRKVADVVDALAAISHLDETVDPPAWLDGSEHGVIVACANELLQVEGRRRLDLTPAFFNTVAVPFDYDPEAPEPKRWLQFLADLWPEDTDAVAALQEWFGYVLSGRSDLQKILLLIGPLRSGKGTIARVLTALVGKGNAAGPTLASIGTNFGLSPLLGKSLAVISDARLDRRNVATVVERLLSISGEDMIDVDRKYKDPWSGRIGARFMLLSNELPRFEDAAGAIASRFVVLQTTRSFLNAENTHLTDELLTELPGILSWSLDGLERLTRNGRFTPVASSAGAVTQLQDLVSPVAAFVRDCCERGAGYDVDTKVLFSAWRNWCEENGHRATNSATFGRDLRAAVLGLDRRRPRPEGEPRSYRYYGIKLHNGGLLGPLGPLDQNDPENRAQNGSGPSGPRENPLWDQHSSCAGCGSNGGKTGIGAGGLCVTCEGWSS